MLAISLSLLVLGVMVAVFGPRGFLLGLGSVFLATLCTIGKALKIVFEVLDLLQIIFDILSLFG